MMSCSEKLAVLPHDKMYIGVGRGGGGGGGGGGRGARGGPGPPNNLRGGANISFATPPNNPPTCTGKTIPLNSILKFSIISLFKMRNVIIWHSSIKNLVGTRRRYDVMCLLGIRPPLLAPPIF